MKAFAKYLPSLFALAVGASAMFAAPVQSYVSAHPAVSGVLASVYAILSHFLPSPQAQ